MLLNISYYLYITRYALNYDLNYICTPPSLHHFNFLELPLPEGRDKKRERCASMTVGNNKGIRKNKEKEQRTRKRKKALSDCRSGGRCGGPFWSVYTEVLIRPINIIL